MAYYYAISSDFPAPTRGVLPGSEHLWEIWGKGRTKLEAEVAALERLGPLLDAVRDGKIHQQNLIRNLTVMRVSEAIDRDYIDMDFDPQSQPAWWTVDRCLNPPRPNYMKIPKEVLEWQPPADRTAQKKKYWWGKD